MAASFAFNVEDIDDAMLRQCAFAALQDLKECSP